MATTTQTRSGAVLITGAAGGIGVATTRRLDALGFQVFMLAVLRLLPDRTCDGLLLRALGLANAQPVS